MTNERITVSITHTIEISGEKSWIKYEASADVEDLDSETDVLAAYVAEKVINIAEEAARVVMAYEEKR